MNDQPYEMHLQRTMKPRSLCPGQTVRVRALVTQGAVSQREPRARAGVVRKWAIPDGPTQAAGTAQRSTPSMQCVAEVRVPGLSGVVGITQTEGPGLLGRETLLAGFRVRPALPRSISSPYPQEYSSACKGWMRAT